MTDTGKPFMANVPWGTFKGTLQAIECFHSLGKHICKFIGTKESVCIRNEFNFQRTGLGHQHGRRFIVLGHQYGRRDVMWKHSIRTQMAGAYYATAPWMVAFHAVAVRAACISSLPTSACSPGNNIPFPLFYSHGMWPMNSFEIKCWQAKQKSYACDSVKMRP